MPEWWIQFFQCSKHFDTKLPLTSNCSIVHIFDLRIKSLSCMIIMQISARVPVTFNFSATIRKTKRTTPKESSSISSVKNSELRLCVSVYFIGCRLKDIERLKSFQGHLLAMQLPCKHREIVLESQNAFQDYLSRRMHEIWQD